MPVTKDIGGGVQLVDFAGIQEGALNRLAKEAQIDEALRKSELAPLETKMKQIDLALKGNQLLNVEVDNDLKRAQLISAKASQHREQVKFAQDQVKTIMGVAANNPELAGQMWQTAFPGGALTANKNGTVTAVFPQGNGFKAFTANPAGVALDPKEQASMENTYRDELIKQVGPYGIQHQSLNAMQGLSKLGTAQGDIGIVINAMRIYDPNSIVREGEVEIARKTPGIPEDLWNKYVRATTSNAPLFGDVGSLTRKKFIEAASEQVKAARDTAITVAQGYYDVAERGGLKGRNVVPNIGDITADMFAVKPDAVPQGKETPPQQVYGTNYPKPAPKETQNASVLPGQAKETERPRPTMNLNQILQKNLMRTK